MQVHYFTSNKMRKTFFCIKLAFSWASKKMHKWQIKWGEEEEKDFLALIIWSFPWVHASNAKEKRSRKRCRRTKCQWDFCQKNQERFSNSKGWWPIFLTFLFWARGRKTVTLSLVFKDPLSAPLNALRLFFPYLKFKMYIVHYKVYKYFS